MMALYRRVLASTFLHSSLRLNSGVLLSARGVAFAANHALLADDRATQTEASSRASERSPTEEGQYSIQAVDLTASLNDMAISLEEQNAENEGSGASRFLEQRETLLEDVEEMAQAATSSMRQAPLPEDFVPPPEASTSAESPPQKPAPRKQAPRAPVSFPTFIPPSDKSRPAKPTMSLDDALQFIKSNAKAKFDETVEAAIKLGVNPKRGDQMVRGAASLPYGSGKPVRVAVFASGAAAEEARAAGADVVGADDLVDAIKKSGGKLDFDRCIATPAMMPMLGQVARILGPRGLMPNPKVGTITNDVGEAVRATKRGRVNFRADKFGIVHVGLGKVSFTDQALKDNLGAFAAALLDAKPAGAKGAPGRYAGYLVNLNMSSSMGKGVKVDVKNVGGMAEALRAHQTS